MKLAIIGVGRMGSEIAYTLMLLRKGLSLVLIEPHPPNNERAVAEFYDLAPVAAKTQNTLTLESSVFSNLDADAFILTSGIARKDSSTPKANLIETNLDIAREMTQNVPRGSTVFVVSNPPVEIAQGLQDSGLNAVPVRKQTDALRERTGRDPVAVNELVLNIKGFTQFTPAYAVARTVLERMDAEAFL